MEKIVAVVIIMFIFSIIILGEGSKLVFQKICERRETAWPDLGTADDEQYEWLTEAYKIKQKKIMKKLLSWLLMEQSWKVIIMRERRMLH